MLGRGGSPQTNDDRPVLMAAPRTWCGALPRCEHGRCTLAHHGRLIWVIVAFIPSAVNSKATLSPTVIPVRSTSPVENPIVMAGHCRAGTGPWAMVILRAGTSMAVTTPVAAAGAPCELSAGIAGIGAAVCAAGAAGGDGDASWPPVCDEHPASTVTARRKSLGRMSNSLEVWKGLGALGAVIDVTARRHDEHGRSGARGR